MGLLSAWDHGRETAEDLLTRIARMGDLPDDEPDLRVRKRGLALTAAGLLPASLIWSQIGIALDRPLLAASSIAFAAVLLVSLAIYSRSKRFDRLARTLLFAGLAYVALGHVAFGGFVAGGGSLVWGLLAPISALLFLSIGQGIRWFMLYGVIVLAAVVFDPQIAQLATRETVAAPIILFAYNVLGPGLIVLLMVRHVDGQRLAAQMQFQSLLENVLPHTVAERLTRGERMIADYHPAATVLFADIVNFTPYAARSTPGQVVLLLNELFSAFDAIASRFGIEKIKTVGDAYLAVAGAPTARSDHARAAYDMALAMHAAVRDRKRLREHGLSLRIGMASGPLVAGVIGRQRYAYDVWGDTVNLAARLQASAQAGEIQVSEATYAELAQAEGFAPRRSVALKGLGAMTTYVIGPNARRADGRRSLPAAHPAGTESVIAARAAAELVLN